MSANRPSQFVDVSKFPANEQPHILELALAHNALAGDVDGITGTTPEEKTMMHNIFGVILRMLAGVHSKRGNAFLFTAQMAVILFVADKLGIDIKLLGPIINHILVRLATAN